MRTFFLSSLACFSLNSNFLIILKMSKISVQYDFDSIYEACRQMQLQFDIKVGKKEYISQKNGLELIRKFYLQNIKGFVKSI